MRVSVISVVLIKKFMKKMYIKYLYLAFEPPAPSGFQSIKSINQIKISVITNEQGASEITELELWNIISFVINSNV